LAQQKQKTAAMRKKIASKVKEFKWRKNKLIRGSAASKLLHYKHYCNCSSLQPCSNGKCSCIQLGLQCNTLCKCFKHHNCQNNSTPEATTRRQELKKKYESKVKRARKRLKVASDSIPDKLKKYFNTIIENIEPSELQYDYNFWLFDCETTGFGKRAVMIEYSVLDLLKLSFSQAIIRPTGFVNYQTKQEKAAYKIHGIEAQ